jgi:hypothetical protein
MFGSGAAIGGTKTIRTHQLTEVPGKLAQIITECSVAVPGAILRSIAAVPFATHSRRAIGGSSGVFGWRYRWFLPRPSFPARTLLYSFTLEEIGG